MSRYKIYSYQDIDPSIPTPSIKYQFNTNAASTGSLLFGGGDATNPVLNILASGITNFYNGYNLNNLSTSETRQIVGYDGTTKTCTLDSPFSSFSVLHSYTTTDPTNWWFIHLQSGASSTDGFYDSDIIVDSQNKTFVSIGTYNGTTKIATLTTFLPYYGT